MFKIGLTNGEKRNLAGSSFASGGHLFFDTGSNEVIFVESVTNALCLAVIGYSSVCLFGKSGANYIDKITPQIRKGKYYLWLDQDGTEEQRKTLDKFSFLIGIEFDAEDTNEKGNFDVNNLLEKYKQNFADKVKYYIGKAKRPQENNSHQWYKGKIIEENNKTYIVKESKEKKLFLVEIANFVIRITTKIYDDEKRVLWKVLLSMDGEKETPLELEGSELNLGHKFREKISSKGLFLVHETKTETHNKFIQWAFEQSNIVKKGKTQYLGRAKGKNFVFCNAIAVPGSSEELTTLIPPDGKMKLSMPNNLVGFWKDATSLFLEVYGPEAWKALGFSVATIFSKEIREHYNFPLLFLNGPKGSGKSELFQIILRLFGAHRQITAFNFASTAKAWYREAQKYIGVPLVLNEYQPSLKNNANIQSLYDAEGYSRAATSNDLETHKTIVNSTFVLVSTRSITGFESQAVISRLVTFDFEAIKISSETKEKWQKIRSLGDELSSFVPQCLSLNPYEILEKAGKSIIQYERETDVESRIVENHVLFQCFANAFLDSLGLRGKKVNDVTSDLEKHQSKTNEANPAILFLQTLEALVTDNRINTNVAKVDSDSKNDKLVFSLNDSYVYVTREIKSSGGDLPDRQTLTKQLLSVGAENLGVKRNKLGDTRKRVWEMERGKYLNLEE